VTVNCAAIPADLFESEFFGHEKGAFTGALQRKRGLLEQSDGGTLFLDEIGDLSPANQARILRALETKQFRRVGGNEEIQVDFRLVAATNRKIAAELESGRFRKDLYHRLKGIEIAMPPLRERRGDIPLLAEYFLQAARAKAQTPPRQLSPRALQYLTSHSWPGNVRELKSCLETALTFCQTGEVDMEDLRAVCGTQDSTESPIPLAEAEKREILKALAHCNGRVVDAAGVLGVSKSKLYNKIAEYGLKQDLFG